VTDLEALKVEAGAAAVDRYVRSGMRLGLGSGSTAARMLEALGERLASGALEDVAGVPTSAATAARCGELGIPLLTLDDLRKAAPSREVYLNGQGAANARPGAKRWEDYTQTAIDPSDDCTIWYVGDYLKKGETNYTSRIGGLRMPGCR
jgi:hypothetical protein